SLSFVPALSIRILLSFVFLLREPPNSPLFPYTTLFRSEARQRQRLARRLAWQRRLNDPVADPRNRLPTLPMLRAWQAERLRASLDRKSTRLNSSHVKNSYAVFCLKKKIKISILSVTILS